MRIVVDGETVEFDVVKCDGAMRQQMLLILVDSRYRKVGLFLFSEGIADVPIRQKRRLYKQQLPCTFNCDSPKTLQKPETLPSSEICSATALGTVN